MPERTKRKLKKKPTLDTYVTVKAPKIKDDLASSDSEGTKEMKEAFEENPQAFIKVESRYYN